MVGFGVIIILFFTFLLVFLFFKKKKLLNRNTKIILFVIFALIFILFIPQNCDTDSKRLGNGFVYNAEHKHITGEIDIPPYVLSFDYDKEYVIAKQKPKEYNEVIYDKREYIYPLGRDSIYYWLIIKKEHKVLGPLNLNQFDSLRLHYNVPKELVLN
jgi:hypothetical protein